MYKLLPLLALAAWPISKCYWPSPRLPSATPRRLQSSSSSRTDAYLLDPSALQPISHTISSGPRLGTRQFGVGTSFEDITDAIPSACSAQCASTLPVLRACYDRDISGCLRVCQQSTYDGFIDCQSCALRENGRTYTASEARLIRGAVSEITGACAQQGSPVQEKEL